MDSSGVAEHLRDAHAGTLSAVAEAVDAVAGSLDLPAERGVVEARLEMALRAGDLLDPLVAALESAMTAAGGELQADPVAASPYVVVTARGPLLRASDGDRRLVVLLRGFELTGPGYDRTEGLRIEAEVRD